MKIGLFYYGYPPKQGGVGHVLDSLLKLFNTDEHKIYFFNPFYNTENTFTIFDRKKYSIRHITSKIKNRIFIVFSIFIFKKLLKDKTIKISDRIKIIIYLLTQPNTLLITIENLMKIYNEVKKLDLDIFLAGTGTGDTLSLVFILSRLFNKKVASLAYGNEFLVHSRFSLRTYFYRNFDLLILGTFALKDLIKKIHHLDENKLAIINYGLIPEEYITNKTREELRKKFNIPDDLFVLLSVGRHVDRKKFDLVIMALKNIKEKHPSTRIKYFLIGEGEETSRLKKMTVELGLEEDVEFLGFTDIETRNNFLKLSDVFVMPSIVQKESIEGFGIVFLEANFFKIPVIGTFSGGIVEAVKNGETGFLIRENDTTDLVDKILFFYHNENKRKSMGMAGYERVIQHFNWNFIVKDYIKLFNDLLSQKK